MNQSIRHLYLCLLCLLCFCSLLLAPSSLYSGEEDLPLPDLITLKPGTVLPPGVSKPEIKGAIQEESESELKIETSSLRGISTVLTFPKASLESTKRGNHAERDYLLLAPLLQLPETSAPADFYQKTLLPRLESYLTKHPDSTQQKAVASFRDTIALELEYILRGDIRFGSFWLLRKSLSPKYVKDLALWSDLDSALGQSSLTEFKSLTDKILEAKNGPYFPYFVDKALAISRKRVQFATEGLSDPAQASSNQPLQDEVKIMNSLSAIDLKPLKKTVSLLAKLQSLVEQSVIDPGEIQTSISECRLLWPDLDGIDHVLLQGFKQKLQNAEGQKDNLASAASTQALNQAGVLLGLIQNAPANLKTELDAAINRETIRQLMAETQQFLSSGQEREAISRIVRIQNLLTPDSPLQQPVLDLTLKATELFTQKGLEESLKLRASGRFEESLDVLIKTGNQLSSYKALDPTRADLLALAAVTIASESAKSLQLLTSIKASYTGWSISPSNLKARISCIIVVVSILAFVLIAVMALVLIWSFFSNILHQDRFKKRLTVLREDQKSHRAASARKRRK